MRKMLLLFLLGFFFIACHKKKKYRLHYSVGDNVKMKNDSVETDILRAIEFNEEPIIDKNIREYITKDLNAESYEYNMTIIKDTISKVNALRSQIKSLIEDVIIDSSLIKIWEETVENTHTESSKKYLAEHFGKLKSDSSDLIILNHELDSLSKNHLGNDILGFHFTHLYTTILSKNDSIKRQAEIETDRDFNIKTFQRIN